MSIDYLEGPGFESCGLVKKIWLTNHLMRPPALSKPNKELVSNLSPSNRPPTSPRKSQKVYIAL